MSELIEIPDGAPRVGGTGCNFTALKGVEVAARYSLVLAVASEVRACIGSAPGPWDYRRLLDDRWRQWRSRRGVVASPFVKAPPSLLGISSAPTQPRRLAMSQTPDSEAGPQFPDPVSVPKPCPSCGVEGQLTLGWRIVLKPIGTWSLAGAQVKSVGERKFGLGCGACGMMLYGWLDSLGKFVTRDPLPESSPDEET